MKLLRRLRTWWPGEIPDQAARREARRVEERRELDRAEAVFGAGQTNKTGG